VNSENRSARDRLDRIVTLAMRSFRFWLPAGVIVVVGGMMAVAFAFTRPRVYRSETLILYREGIRSSDLGGPEGGGDPARKLGLKLKEMVLSRTRLKRIIDEFKLYPKIVDDRGYVDAVDEMRNHISFRVKDGDTFGLAFDGEDRERVQKVTARLAEALIAENSKSREEQAEVTKEFLDVEKRRVETELKEKESNLAQFLAKHPEFAKETASQVPGQNTAGTAIRATMNKGKESQVDPALQALQREASRIQERLAMPLAKKEKQKEVDPRLVAEKQAAESDLRSAQKELSDKLTQFTEQHPDVRAAKTRLRSAELRLKRAEDALNSMPGPTAEDSENDDNGTIDRSTLESELRKVQDEIASYKRRKAVHKDDQPQQSASSWIVAMETEWTRINREVQEARERNQQLQDKQFKASMQESAASSERNAQMVIVDPAYKPTHPSKPSRSLIAGAGLAASLMLAMCVALALALLDDRLYDRVDVESLGAVPLLAVVPGAKKSKPNSKNKVSRG
jgi:uncharacterized protein involved in exopolysaccharide biosynthesis